MGKLKMIVMGHSGHGKDELCKLLMELGGYTSKGSSYTACELFLYSKLKDKYGYTTIRECYNDRHNHQQEWFDEIVAYNTPDLTRLGTMIFNVADIYNGIRNYNEYVALKAAGKFDLTIWVNAIGRKPPEASTSITVEEWMADIILDNNGTKDNLEETVQTLLWFLPMVKPLLLSKPGNTATTFTIKCKEVVESTITTIKRYRR